MIKFALATLAATATAATSATPYNEKTFTPLGDGQEDTVNFNGRVWEER